MEVYAFAPLYHVEPSGRVVLHAMPVMLGALVLLALAYRYYSAFLAARVAALNDANITPAHRFNDGQNYHPTNKWVLFGHHFAAISGAGPLIGPVLAIQYGYMPGLLWLIIGVCLAGAVQDLLVLAASVRHDGKSIAEIARQQLGPVAGIVASLAILFIVVIALAGLGIVVVNALGGEEAKLPTGMQIHLPEGQEALIKNSMMSIPAGSEVRYSKHEPWSRRSEAFHIRLSKETPPPNNSGLIELPAGCLQVVPGSSWGTFTIAATIPIALLVGLWIYKLRPGQVVEGSLLGGVLTLAAVVVGGWIPGSSLEPYFSLSRNGTIVALTAYGFVAAVLPVWLLLGPRDYLSSFLKIGTVILLIGSVLVANPPLQAPELNEVFLNGGPTFEGNIFPFVFICVMCGAVSGFHSLVSSGTTPKMVDQESHIRRIGYGAMLVEGIVGLTALIAAACLPPQLYYDINVPIDLTPQYQSQVLDIHGKYGAPRAAGDPLHAAHVSSLSHLELGDVETKVGGESLRGRVGGAVTLAVGMSLIFERAFSLIGITGDWLLKYWYHFAIMFEALFILTTIDAGTRIGRFLLQETVGRVYRPFARPDWLPGSILASALITGSWGLLIYSGSIRTIWPMFGIANQLLAILALAIVTTWLVNTGKGRYIWVTLLPMIWVCSTTLTAGSELILVRFQKQIAKGQELVATGIESQVQAGQKMIFTGLLNSGLTCFVMTTVIVVLLLAASRWVGVLTGLTKPKTI